MHQHELPSFSALNISKPVLAVLEQIGYESPSPIQAEMIPYVLEGRDVIGQAQTGTGKTAAFALPILTKIDLNINSPQVLVLAPTRELAIQVSEAFHKYAANMKGFHVLPVYGGQDYQGQMRQLKRGVHVVVGTPGRVMDHIRRKTLNLSNLTTLVLDEADEMLRMGFIDDVEWIMEHIPEQRQIALFSATMPKQIHKIAQTYLNNPKEITIKVKTTTADTIRQRYWMVSGHHKLDALTRILETEEFDAVIIFVRTRNATVELTERLEARGYATAALNGDIAQNQREKVINRLKKQQIDIVVATDVAARGIDVARVSHVINYDVPYDTEAYVHRIGRTGRAGRKGEAILFIAPREKRMLKQIENATRQKISQLEMPSTEVINNKRIARFTQKITDTLANEELDFYANILGKYSREHNVSELEIAAALTRMYHDEEPLLLSSKPDSRKFKEKDSAKDKNLPGKRKSSGDKQESNEIDEGMQRFRLEVGHIHEVKPGNIVGAIANEAGLDGKYIGRIQIFDDYSLIDLPEGMPKDIYMDLKSTRIAGQKCNISVVGDNEYLKTTKPKKQSGKKATGKKSTRKKSRSKKKDTNKRDKTTKKKQPKKKRTKS